MLDRFLVLHEEVNDLIDHFDHEYELKMFNDNEIEQIQAWRDVLEPIERILRHSEGDRYVTIAHVPQWIQEFRELCQARFERPSRSFFRSRLQQSVNTRLLSLIEVRECPMDAAQCTNADDYFHPSGIQLTYAVMAAALHPKYVQLKFLNTDIHTI